jgi:hypothetical protein
MLVPREWNNEQEVFDAIYTALEESESLKEEGFQIRSFSEKSSYKEQGYFRIITPNGTKVFAISLQEVQ